MQRPTVWLIIVLVLVAGAAYVVTPGTPLTFTIGETTFDRSEFRQGLDLQGGVQVLMEAVLPAGTVLEPQKMQTVRQIIEQRVNALGVAEPLVQTQGERQERIVVELPGYQDPAQAIATIKETGLLEFVPVPPELGGLADGSLVNTNCPDPSRVDCGHSLAVAPSEPAPTAVATQPATGTLAALTPEPILAGPALKTLMTGASLSQALVERDQTTGEWVVNFRLNSEGARLFSEHTRNHIGEQLAIVLDKRVISAPVIRGALSSEGTISGSFTRESANQLALVLSYGALPVPLQVVESRVVGPSLGQDSLNRSLVAGVIGFIIVILFMAIYYRVPGLAAVVALLCYATITLALFKLVPVTLSLPGIAGFLLSTGSALDANILIFERLKEELRSGRSLSASLRPAWRRAWSSIRDSNIATLIICAILYWFGSSFGASIVQGFAITLAVGVGISLFSALVITRAMLTALIGWLPAPEEHLEWFGA